MMNTSVANQHPITSIGECDTDASDYDSASPTSVKEELCISTKDKRSLSINSRSYLDDDGSASIATKSTYFSSFSSTVSSICPSRCQKLTRTVRFALGEADGDEHPHRMHDAHRKPGHTHRGGYDRNDDGGGGKDGSSAPDRDWTHASAKRHYNSNNSSSNSVDNACTGSATNHTLVLTEEDRRNGWWTKEEHERNFERTKRIVCERRNRHDDGTDEFVKLFSICATCPKKLREFAFADLNKHRDNRGLERYMHDVLSRYKGGMIKSILEIQSKLPRSLDSDARAKLLAIKSAQLSKPSRALARFLAKQDEREVLEHIQDEFNKGSCR